MALFGAAFQLKIKNIKAEKLRGGNKIEIFKK